MPATPTRRCAYTVVRRVFERGAYADRAFRSEAERHGLRGRDRAFAMRLAYGTIQRKATLDYLAGRLCDRPLDDLDARVLAALRIGLYQLAFMEGVARHAAVSESVELAKDGRSGVHRFVNAILRRGAREVYRLVEELGDTTPAETALRHSHPRWIAELWWRALGPSQARAALAHDNEPAESAVRANLLKVRSAESLIEALEREGVSALPGELVPEAVVLEEPFDAHGSSLFAAGALMPQSRASMLVARVLDPQPGERLLDLCAAPGAKTTQIAALLENRGEVVAVEADADRVRAIGENCRRLGASCVRVECGDASEVRFGSGFDRVLVDPPCSDLGTLQSRPDARWRKQPDQVAALAQLQSRILAAGASALRPGGVLVYSTCTINPAENELQIERFLEVCRGFSTIDLSSRHPGLALANSRSFLQTLPHRDGTDGFFIAALRKGG